MAIPLWLWELFFPAASIFHGTLLLPPLPFLKVSKNLQNKKIIRGEKTFVISQSEDEISALAQVIGAGWAGLRAMTVTSGPGLSLMSEGAGLAYFAEVPAVLCNVQRAGPSTGLPHTHTTRRSSDLLFSLPWRQLPCGFNARHRRRMFLPHTKGF